MCLRCRYLTAQDMYESVAERRLVAKKNDELYGEPCVRGGGLRLDAGGGRM